MQPVTHMASTDVLQIIVFIEGTCIQHATHIRHTQIAFCWQHTRISLFVRQWASMISKFKQKPRIAIKKAVFLSNKNEFGENNLLLIVKVLACAKSCGTNCLQPFLW